MKLALLFLVVSLASIAFGESNQSEDKMKRGDHELEFISSYDKTKQPYRLLIPGSAPEENAPLVLALHGKGVDQHAWFTYTPVEEAVEQHGYILAAPFGRGNYWYRGPAERDVLDIVEDVKNRWSIDSSRIYLIGHSMGGWGTWWVSLRNPDVFAAAVPMAGLAPSDLLLSATHTPTFIIHDEDDPIVSVRESRVPAAGLGELGISHRYLETNDYGHASSIIGDNFDRIFAWLGEHQLDSSPKRIAFASRSPRAGTAFWVKMLELENFPRAATIKAAVDEINKSIRIQTYGLHSFAVHQSAALGTGPETSYLVNDQEIDAVKADWAKFEFRDGKWLATGVAKEPQTPAARLVASPWEERLTDENQEVFTRSWAEILLGEVDADVALFTTDMFRDTGWPLDEDMVADVFTYPVDLLGRISMTGKEIEESQEKYSDIIISTTADLGNLEDSAIYSVIAPVNVAESLQGKFELLPHRVGEYLVDSLRRQNSQE